MADFCKQCSEELFGKDFEDLANLKDEILPNGYGWPVICEGCGPTIVNNNGECICKGCDKHGEKADG